MTTASKITLLRVALIPLYMVFMYLSGADLTAALIQRGLTDVLATTGLTAVIMVPVRKLLGFRKKEEVPVAELRFDRRPARD